MTHERNTMLVLSRKIRESIIVGDSGEIEIEVLDIRNGKVRIGISAPKETPVFRSEVWARIQSERIVGTDGITA